MSSVRDILVVACLLFAIGLSVMLIVDLSHRINVKILTTPVFNDSAEAVSVIQHSEAAVNMTDYIYFALFVAFFISVMVFGYFVGGHPIMAPIYFFMVVIFAFVAVILQLVWIDIVATPEFLGASMNLPLTTFILTNLGMITVVTGLLGILAMFAKPSETGGMS